MKYTNFILTVIAILLLGILLGTTNFISSAKAQTTAASEIINVKIVGVGRVSTYDQQPLPSKFMDGHTFYYLPVQVER